MKTILKTLVLAGFMFVSCQNEPSLQKYYVENAENKNFISFDISPTILNLETAKLTLEQQTALKSFQKMNVLAFKVNESNKSEFSVEKTKVQQILKDEKYQQLMKFGSGKDGASISYVGDENHINEFILYGNKSDAGFAVVRILGKDMNPNNIMTLVEILKNSKSTAVLEQLKPLQELLIKK